MINNNWWNAKLSDSVRLLVDQILHFSFHLIGIVLFVNETLFLESVQLVIQSTFWIQSVRTNFTIHTNMHTNIHTNIHTTIHLFQSIHQLR